MTVEENRSNQRSPAAAEHLPHEGSTKRALSPEALRSPLRFLIVIIAGTAIAESIAMVVVYFYRFLPYYQQVLLDAAIMVIIISPLLYLLSTRPLIQQIEQRIQTERILQARLTLIQYASTHPLEELLRFTLDQIEALTGSRFAYFHFLESDQKTPWLRTWSTHTLQNMCTVSGQDSH